MPTRPDDFVLELEDELASLSRHRRLDALKQFHVAFGSSGNLLSACLGLRMAHTGAREPYLPEHAASRIAALKLRLQEWEPSYDPKRAAFDEAVRQLILATLNEVSGE